MCGLASVVLVRRRASMATIRPGALDRTHHNSLQDTTRHTRWQADKDRKEHIQRLLVVKVQYKYNYKNYIIIFLFFLLILM